MPFLLAAFYNGAFITVLILMTDSSSLQTIRHLIQRIADKLPESEQHLVSALETELAKLQDNENANTRSSPLRPDIDPDSGCYRFQNDPAYYCPTCFDRLQQRIATQRINRKLRVCPQCRNSLRPRR